MVTASVGFHCPECTRGHTQESVRGRDVFALARSRAVVTEAIIAINVVVFVIDVATGAGSSAADPSAT